MTNLSEGIVPNGQNDLDKVNVRKRGWLRRLFAFVGPAYLVSVGYMDPGNWATDIEGGARFGYTLIWVLLMSNLMAVLLQTLSARLGIVTGYDLAQACRREYSRTLGYILWVLAEIAIAATDLAEVIGTIIGLNLLFGLPLLWGCLVAAFDTFLLLAIQRFGIRKMEGLIVMMVGTIGACFIIEIFLSQPQWGAVAKGFIPHLPPEALFVAIGIIGATVMPHNLYLHSSLVQSRLVSNTITGKKEACWYNFLDSFIALNGAFFVNAAILITAAATFFTRGIVVSEIQQASNLLHSTLGTRIAPFVFGLGLLAAGQSSTVTGTISGQVVMEGFLNFKMRPWLRRLLTRSIALTPAVIAIAYAGDKGIYHLLIASQVLLSLQLPFAIIPLVHFTSDRKKMGIFASPIWARAIAWVVAAIIIVLNAKLLIMAVSNFSQAIPQLFWLPIGAILVALGGLLIYLLVKPIVHPAPAWESGTILVPQVTPAIKPMQFRHIGLALEHAEGDSDILAAALAIAPRDQAKLTLVHVVESPGTMMLGKESRSLHSERDLKYLEQLARQVESDKLPVEVTLRYGQPAKEIIEVVHESGIDMLIMGSHGHQGLEDLLYGQTVNTVRHALGIPVMVVRTHGVERAQSGVTANS